MHRALRSGLARTLATALQSPRLRAGRLATLASPLTGKTSNHRLWLGIAAGSLTLVGAAYVRQQPETVAARTKGHHQFIADAVEKVSPSVVSVTSSFHTFFGDLGQGGSGFVLSEDGFIATNSHVVTLAMSAKAKQVVTVTLTDGTQLEGEVWATDVNTDLALIKVNPPVGYKLQKAAIGSSSSLRPGEWVVAIGSPMNLQNTVTMGVVSSIARQATDLGMNRSFDFIQTDCSINSGNSGGPLCDLDGAVVGINTMKAAGPEGISFAIPIDSAFPVLEQLREFKKVRRPYLGIKMITLEPHMVRFAKQRSGDFPDIEGGVYVAEVINNSPAARAGVQVGDIVVSMDTTKVVSGNDVLKALGFDIGKSLTITIVRGNATKTVTVKTEQAPN